MTLAIQTGTVCLVVCFVLMVTGTVHPNKDKCLGRWSCNHGSCEKHCLCEAGWTGMTCNEENNRCLPNPCFNGATCTYNATAYTCTCADGFSGDQCQTDEDGCESSPCDHGECINLVGPGYNCDCEAGYTGDDCDQDINECDSNPCFNSGTCVNGEAKFTCTCAAGWTGDQCQTAQPTGDYLGCYVDQGNRDLGDYWLEARTHLTVESCVTFCFALGNKYAGLQYTYQCFCGDEYGTYGPAPSESQCGRTCAGNSAQICGGGWRNSVYATGH